MAKFCTFLGAMPIKCNDDSNEDFKSKHTKKFGRTMTQSKAKSWHLFKAALGPYPPLMPFFSVPTLRFGKTMSLLNENLEECMPVGLRRGRHAAHLVTITKVHATFRHLQFRAEISVLGPKKGKRGAG